MLGPALSARPGGLYAPNVPASPHELLEDDHKGRGQLAFPFLFAVIAMACYVSSLRAGRSHRVSHAPPHSSVWGMVSEGKTMAGTVWTPALAAPVPACL